MLTQRLGIGFIVKALGGVGIDRSQRNDLVNFVKMNLKR